MWNAQNESALSYGWEDDHEHFNQMVGLKERSPKYKISSFGDDKYACKNPTGSFQRKL